MPKVPFTAFFQGPLAVYPSPTAQTDPITGGIYLGTEFIEGNYADVSNEDAQQWNYAYGTQLKGGRYRICRLATNAIQANLPQTSGKGGVVGWAAGTFVQGATIAAAGSGYANGTYNCVSTYNIGSQAPAIAQVVVSGGAIIAASVIAGGGPFLVAPTFSLSELTGGTGGSVLAQLFQSSSYVSSFDSTALAGGAGVSLVRGITYAAPTQAQITAGAWIVVQESGVAQVNILTAGSATPGAQVVASSAAAGGKCVTQAPAYSALEVGFTLATTATNTTNATFPVKLTIPEVDD